MKKITLKIKSLLLVAVAVLFSTSAVQAQEWTTNGTYTIGVPGEDLFISVNPDTGVLEWAARNEDNPNQIWAIVDHPTPMSAGYMQITSEHPEYGITTLGTVPENISGKNITLVALERDVVTDAAAADYGYDQFQRRKTTTNNGGNDALFIKVPGEGGSRFGVTPAAAGDPVQFDGGGIDKLEFTLIEEILSSSSLEASAISVAAANDNLVISGLTSDVNKVSVYSLLGQAVIAQSIDGSAAEVTLNISGLASGMYIVKLDGANGSFSEKIIKQ